MPYFRPMLQQAAQLSVAAAFWAMILTVATATWWAPIVVLLLGLPRHTELLAAFGSWIGFALVNFVGMFAMTKIPRSVDLTGLGRYVLLWDWMR